MADSTAETGDERYSAIHAIENSVEVTTEYLQKKNKHHHLCPGQPRVVLYARLRNI